MYNMTGTIYVNMLNRFNFAREHGEQWTQVDLGMAKPFMYGVWEGDSSLFQDLSNHQPVMLLVSCGTIYDILNHLYTTFIHFSIPTVVALNC